MIPGCAALARRRCHTTTTSAGTRTAYPIPHTTAHTQHTYDTSHTYDTGHWHTNYRSTACNRPHKTQRCRVSGSAIMLSYHAPYVYVCARACSRGSCWRVLEGILHAPHQMPTGNGGGWLSKLSGVVRSVVGGPADRPKAESDVARLEAKLAETAQYSAATIHPTTHSHIQRAHMCVASLAPCTNASACINACIGR